MASVYLMYNQFFFFLSLCNDLRVSIYGKRLGTNSSSNVKKSKLVYICRLSIGSNRSKWFQNSNDEFSIIC